MWEVLFTVCTLLGECKESRVQIIQERPPSVFECGLYAQVEIAKYCERHPGYGPKHWRCGRPTRDT